MMYQNDWLDTIQLLTYKITINIFEIIYIRVEKSELDTFIYSPSVPNRFCEQILQLIFCLYQSFFAIRYNHV